MNCALRFNPRVALVLALYCLAGLAASSAAGALSRPLGSLVGLGFGLGGALLGLALALLGWAGARRR
jgi:hypothetical protein